MDNNDSNLKSQQTGGLKLMTVFIAVLALHVVVIGGFTVYHLMSGGSSDADLTTIDKTHKDAKSTDGTTVTETAIPDATQADKSATTTTTPADITTIPASAIPTPTVQSPDASATASTTPAPTPAPSTTSLATSSTPTMAPAPTPMASVPAPAPAITPAPTLVPTPTLTLNAPKPQQFASAADMAHESAQTPSGPISPTLAPPPDVAPSLNTAPLSAGPVHMPAMTSTSAAAKPSHEHEQIYTVKITDSYKKIAHAHHITVAQLKEANHIKGDVLHTGQKLFIPSDKKFVAESAPASALDSAPTSLSVAPMNTSLSSTTTTSTVASTGLHHHLYTIEKGDTLTKIAHKFKTTTAAIIAENGNIDPSKLTIGHKLKIPSRESRSAQNAAPATTQPSQVESKPAAGNGQLATFVP